MVRIRIENHQATHCDNCIVVQEGIDTFLEVTDPNKVAFYVGMSTRHYVVGGGSWKEDVIWVPSKGFSRELTSFDVNPARKNSIRTDCAW